MNKASYGPEEVSRDLAKIQDGTASFEDRAQVEHFLLMRLREEGHKGVADLLVGLQGHDFGDSEHPDSSEDCNYSSALTGRPRLIVSTHASADLASVDVTVEADATLPPKADPRHQAFYSMWEGLLGATSSEVARFAPKQRAVFLIGLLEAEVMNGGFGQYLTNTDGTYLSETLDCLEQIGAQRTRTLLSDAAELGAEGDSYAAAWDDASSEFSRLDDAFLESGEDLAGMTAEAFLVTQTRNAGVCPRSCL